MARAPSPPRLAVFKFASCDGCQLSLLDCEDELLAVADAVQIAYFPEATSTMLPGPYDIGLVEGSITTPDDARRILEVRASTKRLVTLGACATAGGIQALRNHRDVAELRSIVYATPRTIETLATSTAISAHVAVDYELRGCPVDKHQLLEVLGALLHGRVPNVSSHAVCLDCKMNATPCVMVSRGLPCLGPVTHTGCGALCPRYERGCFGCYGPAETPNTSSLAEILARAGASRPEILRLFRSFCVDAPAFRAEAEKHGG